LTAISQVRANAKSDVDAIIADEEDFLKALEGIPQRAWSKCPNHNEAINEKKFRERFAESLDTMSRAQIDKIRHTMTERRLASFSEETRTFITESVDRALTSKKSSRESV
jgi:predicted RNA-binding protein Jag